jgi:hypothetical protein
LSLASIALAIVLLAQNTLQKLLEPNAFGHSFACTPSSYSLW